MQAQILSPGPGYRKGLSQCESSEQALRLVLELRKVGTDKARVRRTGLLACLARNAMLPAPAYIHLDIIDLCGPCASLAIR
jgi:hypothetical protein